MKEFIQGTMFVIIWLIVIIGVPIGLIKLYQSVDLNILPKKLTSIQIEQEQKRCKASGLNFELASDAKYGYCYNEKERCIYNASQLIESAYNNPDTITNPDEVTKNTIEILKTCEEINNK